MSHYLMAAFEASAGGMSAVDLADAHKYFVSEIVDAYLKKGYNFESGMMLKLQNTSLAQVLTCAALLSLASSDSPPECLSALTSPGWITPSAAPLQVLAKNSPIAQRQATNPGPSPQVGAGRESLLADPWVTQDIRKGVCAKFNSGKGCDAPKGKCPLHKGHECNVCGDRSHGALTCKHFIAWEKAHGVSPTKRARKK
jgi:hypothetical protein